MRGRWLLAALYGSGKSSLCLWSVPALLRKHDTRPIAQAFLDGPVNSGVVDIQDKTLIIAVEVGTERWVAKFVTLVSDRLI